MIEAIQVAAEAAQPAAASPAQSPQASAYDIREFAAAFDRGSAPGAAGGVQAGGVAQAGAAEPSQGTRAVLAALDNLNGGAESIGQASQSISANAAELTPGEMIQMTMKCHQFMFTSQLTSNVANRTSDGIQQLFRQQS
ncbi:MULTISPECIES: hypothetical protein [Lysobacter]|uniref:Type III secretion protein HrpB2 n=1 Tax=Lysobacter yananisis TaxID=1003114 RepID=A0ABY9PEF0_9GAMM|nr:MULTISPECIES: hypothetical protein [Lysobacter]QQQ01596.1 hypothetical protein JHW41_01025 [Lysobacter enzymogenes]WMT04749.1 hypothetical protein RDV84_07905 [Lysobacter yananisis]SDY85732.1 hypothetical protein SAMN04487939_10745 [Lysobacter sp. yr284]